MKTKIISFCLLLFIIATTTKAQEWEFVGLDSMVIKQLYVSGDSIWAGTVSRISIDIISGFYKSTDKGYSWEQIDSFLGYGGTFGFHISSENNSILLVKHIISTPYGGLLYESTDNGNSWKINEGLDNIYLDWIGVSPFNENEIYVKEYNSFPAGAYETVYRSINGGINWLLITNFPSSSHGRKVTFNLSLVNSSTLYATSDDNLISTFFFKSIDKGTNWYNLGVPPTVGRELIIDPNTPSRIFIFPGYYLTSDDGNSWTVSDSGLIDVSSYLSFYIDPSDKAMFYNLRKDGLYYSKNDPIHWQLVDGSDTLPLNLGGQGFLNSDIGHLRNIFIDKKDNVLYVGTARGIYKRDLISSSEIILANPSEYLLYQNYPNPFNPTTAIDYSIKSSGLVSLKVYDMLGTEVTSLVNENKEAGSYSVEFNAEDLPSGIYFYTLTSGNFIATKKLILLK